MVINSSVSKAILALTLSLGLLGWSFADDLEGVLETTRQQTLLTQKKPMQAADQAARCFKRAKLNGTVWLPTQQLVDELTQVRASVKESMTDRVRARRIKSLSKTILRHCELIENQHALERARYVLATLDTGTLDEASVEAVRDMLVAADGHGALRLVRRLVSQLPSVSR